MKKFLVFAGFLIIGVTAGWMSGVLAQTATTNRVAEIETEERIYAQPVPDESPRPELADSIFTVEDPLTDRARTENGDVYLRVYSQPRPIFTENGVRKVRPAGWNAFTADASATILTNQGYEFSVPLSEERMRLKAGVIEVQESGRVVKTIEPQKSEAVKRREGYSEITEISDVYPGITVLFADQGISRQKFITLLRAPEITKEQSLIFWDEYTLPSGAEVRGPDNQIIQTEARDVVGELFVSTRTGKIKISGSIVYDNSSQTINEIEARAQSVPYDVIVDRETGVVKIGVKITAEYFLSPERKYPVTIDPTINLCLEVTCTTTQLYLRYLTSNSVMYGAPANYLLIGYTYDGGHATRQPLLRFMSNNPSYFPGLTSNGPLTSAELVLTRSDNAGTGTATSGSVPTQAMKISTSWSASSVIYGNPATFGQGIHDYLSAVNGSSISIPVGIAQGQTVKWNITSLVQDWMNGTANNGVYLSPTPHWTSGASPGWTNKIFWFWSGSAPSNYPYLVLKFADKADLTDNGSDMSPYNVEVNKPVSITFRVRNGGGTAASNSAIKYYVNPQSNCSGRVNMVGIVQVPSLAAGATFNQVVSYTPTVAGNYCVQYDIDFDNVISESNEDNNKFFLSPFTVTAAAKPDVSIDAFSANASQNYYSGTQFSHTVTIRNTGSVAASNLFYSGTLRQANNGALFPFICNSGYTYNIPANSANTYSLVCSLPTVLSSPNTTYYVQYKLDPSDVIAESDETNNSRESSNTITVIQGDYANAPGGIADPNGNSVPLASKLSALNGDASKAVNLSLQTSQSVYTLQSKIPADITKNIYTADPVNARTGAFEFSQTDFSLSSFALPLEFTRTYTSKFLDRNVRFGRGWSHSYHQYYYQNPTTQEVQIYLGGALASYFTPTGDGVNFTASRGDTSTLKKENDYLVYRTLDGLTYRFSQKLSDTVGMVKEIEDRNGNKTTLGYIEVRGVDLLSTITDRAGRSLQLIYPTDTLAANWDKVKEIREANAGTERVVATYGYDGNLQLTTVSRERTYGAENESLIHQYSYDSNGLMTSYTDARGVILYNEYDTSNSASALTFGRVVKQYEHNVRLDGANPATKRLIYELVYSDSPDNGVPGSVRCSVTKNYRNATANYEQKFCFNASELKIYEATGSTVQKWEYDTNGSATKYSDGAGNEWLYQYDGRRRISQEILPDTDWRTVITYEYENNYNQLVNKIQTYRSVTNPNVILNTKLDAFTVDAKGNYLTHRDPENKTESWEYNPNGTIKKYTDKRGSVISYTYTANGDLATETKTITQADATTQTAVIQYGYDSYGRKISETDARGNVTTFAYDSNGNLRKIIQPTTKLTLFTYDAMNNLKQRVDNFSQLTNFILDTDIQASQLSVQRENSALGISETKREYDYVANPIKEIDALGNVVTITYDAANRVASRTDNRQTTTFEYYPTGKLKKETSTAGTRVDYFYDARGQKIEERRYWDASNYISLQWEYDGFGRVSKQIDGRGNQTLYEYDGLDRVVKKTDALQGVSRYFYDANGNVVGERTPRAEADASMRNANGYSITRVFDENNRVSKVTNALNRETRYLYDLNGNLTKQIDWQAADGSEASKITRHEYDSLNRKTKTIFADNSVISYTYNSRGLLQKKTDQMGRQTTYTYDDYNRLTAESLDGYTTSYLYDKADNRTRVTYPDGTKTDYTYNDLHKVQTITDAAGGTEQFVYNAFGLVTKQTNQNGRVTNFVYDSLNRLISESNAAGTVTTYAYDNANNRITQVRAGVTTSFQFDALNRPTKITYPGNKTETTNYNADGTAVSVTNGKNQTTTMVVDALGRVTHKTMADGETADYVYDAWNNVTQLTDSSGVTTRTYNEMHQETGHYKNYAHAALQGETIRYLHEYHPDGSVRTITDAATRAYVYAYDNRGLLTTVSWNGQTLAQYSYTSFGKLQQITYGNGVVTSYGYDSLHRPTAIVTKNSGNTVLWSENYTYDPASNRATMTDHTGRTVVYEYDTIDQLTKATYTVDGTANAMEYVYDAHGNRTKLITPLGSTDFVYTGSNELDSVVNNQQKIVYQNDANGAVSKETHFTGTENAFEIAYAYTAHNQLRSITRTTADPLTGMHAVSFAYDDTGNRISKTGSDQKTVFYLNHGLSVLNEIGDNRQVEKSLVPGVGTVAEIDRAGVITYVHQDVLGSTALLTNTTGAVVREYDYDAFGEVIGSQGSITTNYLFTGQELDPESELYYFNARYYNPATGRFISRDPLLGQDGDFLSRNNYIYAKNNPFKYIDLDGMEAKQLLSLNGAKGFVNGVKEGGVSTLHGIVDLFTTNPINTIAQTGKAIGNMYVDAYNDSVYLYNRVGEVGFSGLVQDTKYSASELGKGWDNMSGQEKGELLGYSAEKVVETFAGTKLLSKPLQSVSRTVQNINPLANTTYTSKVLRQMWSDEYHGFPKIIDNFGSSGKISDIVGVDKIVRTKLEIPGSLNGKNGIFEYIIESDKSINHRLFKPN